VASLRSVVAFLWLLSFAVALDAAEALTLFQPLL